MNFIDVGEDLMVNLDNVSGIERSGQKCLIYIGLTGESVTTQVDYDVLRSIIISRSSRMQQSPSQPLFENMAKDLRQMAKSQRTPVP